MRDVRRLLYGRSGDVVESLTGRANGLVGPMQGPTLQS